MIRILPDAGALARAAADLVVTRAAEAIRVEGRFILVLSGGSTPETAYTLLGSEPRVHAVDWGRVHLLWGDERCVLPDDPRSNYRMARLALLDRAPIPPSQVHRIHGEDDPAAAATAYEGVLASLLGRAGPGAPPARGPDLVLLGLGEDGHTASMFPGHAAVGERARWVVAERGGPGDLWRVTLTPVVLGAAVTVAFLVSGTGKAHILQTVLEGPPVPDRLPAQAVGTARGGVLWLADSDAASALRTRPPATA